MKELILLIHIFSFVSSIILIFCALLYRILRHLPLKKATILSRALVGTGLFSGISLIFFVGATPARCVLLASYVIVYMVIEQRIFSMRTSKESIS